MELTRRRFSVGGEEWLAIELRRPTKSPGLCYFILFVDGGPSGDDRTDRRALLEAGETLAGLGEDSLRSLLQSGAPLTVTERRYTDERGELWLAQSTGPVWAGAEVAAGLTGHLLTSLSDGRRVEGKGGDLGSLTGGDSVCSG